MSSGSDKGGAGRYAVYCGVDVGKSDHHACALDPEGNRLYDRRPVLADPHERSPP